MFLRCRAPVALLLVCALGGVALATPRTHHRPPKHARAQLRSGTTTLVAEREPGVPIERPTPVVLTPEPAPPVAVVPDAIAPPAPPPPPADVTARERRWGLFAGGTVLFLSGYSLDIGLTYGLGHQPSGTSLVPLVGPLIQMGDTWTVVSPSTSGNPQVDQVANQKIAEVNHAAQTAAYAVLAIDFTMQLAGVTMAIVGLVGKRPDTTRRIMPTAGGIRVAF
jgi:hypothetical protein